MGDCFMYIQTNGNINGQKFFVSLERTDVIEITNTTFNYNRYSDPSNNHRSMGRFRVQARLPNGQCFCQYIIIKNTFHTKTSTEWTLQTIDFTEKNYGKILIHDEIDTG